jgi:hypothetical protein
MMPHLTHQKAILYSQFSKNQVKIGLIAKNEMKLEIQGQGFI